MLRKINLKQACKMLVRISYQMEISLEEKCQLSFPWHQVLYVNIDEIFVITRAISVSIAFSYTYFSNTHSGCSCSQSTFYHFHEQLDYYQEELRYPLFPDSTSRVNQQWTDIYHQEDCSLPLLCSSYNLPTLLSSLTSVTVTGLHNNPLGFRLCLSTVSLL